jgi:hypothetical protein
MGHSEAHRRPALTSIRRLIPAYSRAYTFDDPAFEPVGREGPNLSASAAYASREWLVWFIPPVLTTRHNGRRSGGCCFP